MSAQQFVPTQLDDIPHALFEELSKIFGSGPKGEFSLPREGTTHYRVRPLEAVGGMTPSLAYVTYNDNIGPCTRIELLDYLPKQDDTATICKVARVFVGRGPFRTGPRICKFKLMGEELALNVANPRLAEVALRMLMLSLQFARQFPQEQDKAAA